MPFTPMQLITMGFYLSLGFMFAQWVIKILTIFAVGLFFAEVEEEPKDQPEDKDDDAANDT